jgi:hypothetical protein
MNRDECLHRKENRLPVWYNGEQYLIRNITYPHLHTQQVQLAKTASVSINITYGSKGDFNAFWVSIDKVSVTKEGSLS